MKKNDSYGMSMIDKNLTKSWLSFLSVKAELNGVDESENYLKVTSVFDLLSALNYRDNRLARAMINPLLDISDMKFKWIIMALDLWEQGKIQQSRGLFLTHLQEFPCDVTCIQMLHQQDFLFGNSSGYQDYLEEKKLCGDKDFNGFYLGIRAFALCELGNVKQALHEGLIAAEHNPQDIYAIHAIAHCFHTMCDFQSVIEFLEKCRKNWIHNPGMNMHIYWHLAVGYLMLGDIEQAVKTYYAFRNLKKSPGMELELDAINFLARYYLLFDFRSDMKEELTKLCMDWAPSIYNSCSYFNDLHAALAFMLSGNEGLMTKLISKPNLQFFGEEACKTGRSILQAVNHFSHEEFEQCHHLLTRYEMFWPRIGGSIAQREVLELLNKKTKSMFKNRERKQEVSQMTKKDHSSNIKNESLVSESEPYYFGYEARYARTYAEGGESWEALEPNLVVTEKVPEMAKRFRAFPIRIVDFGCGEGRDSLWLANNGFDVTGVDISPSALARATDFAKARGIAVTNFIQDDVIKMSKVPKSCFHIALNMGCLHMLDNLVHREEHLKNVHSTLVEGGVFLIAHCVRSWLEGFWSVENYESVQNAKVGDIIPRKIRLPDGTTKIIQLPVLNHMVASPEHLTKELEKVGFTDIECELENRFTFGNAAIFTCRKG